MAQKIILVDDDEFIHKTIHRIFKDSQYELIDAYNGKEGIEKVNQHKPDLILLDVKMPEKDGYAVVREIRGNKTTRGIPILMLTGEGEVLDQVVGYELGVEDYITKPFKPQKLTQHVKSFLGR